MSDDEKRQRLQSAREKFLGLSLESTRKSYYPQLKQQLEAAKEKEQRLQLLIDNLPARVAYVGSDERYLLVNQEYERLFKIPREKIIGRSIRSLIGEENYRRHTTYRQSALRGETVHFESKFLLPDGRSQFHEISFVPMFDSSGRVEGFYVLGIDITERKRAAEEAKQLEAKLHDAQKFKAIGTLAGGIAHDFNNLLMGIQGRASLLAVNLEPSHPLMEHVLAIEEHIRSATDLTKQLLGFARGGKYEVKPVELNELVAKSANMFGRTRKQIRIHIKTAEAAVVAEIDQPQIEQVLLNLFVNAWQAMPQGGDLYVEISSVMLDDHYCRPHEMESGAYARISITDTGIGIPAAILKRVFDPFFTTKEKQRGTGLGLASAYGIVRNHGGVITVYSEPGDGTTFNIMLPLSEKDAVQDVPAVAKLVGGTGHVLLVDDEQMILEVGRSMLETLGYTVSVAEGGKEAVSVLENKKEIIDLVILDMIMPDLNGGATFNRLKEIKPDVKVILSSGYSLNGQAQSIIERGCSAFIQKPFTISDLSSSIRKVLDS